MADDLASAGVDLPKENDRGDGGTSLDRSLPATFSLARSYREVFAWIVWTVLADRLVFHSVGFAGPALFIASVPLVFLVGSKRWGCPWPATICCVVLWLVAARIAWSPGALALLVAVAFIPALARAVGGEFPLVLESLALGLRSMFDGMVRLATNRISASLPFANDTREGSRARGVASTSGQSGAGLAISLPIVAAVAFASIFVFANPDLHRWVSGYVNTFKQQVWELFAALSVWEIPFCIAALFIVAGLLRPRHLGYFGPRPKTAVDVRVIEAKSPLYAAFRNTLVTLIALFAVYLAFEFITLWRRDFPEGFYYAGYAHEGAAWLTLALAMATGVLSLVFRGRTLGDPRVAMLRRLAWVWSAENFLLAVAVYNRLLIYVGYNGMTMMRTVGFFGISIVVVGVVLVLVKIAKGRSFWWLVRAQLVALALGITLYAVTPVDYIAHRYNVQRVLAGDPRPSVMIAVKPIDDEGYFPLLALTGVENRTIREGVLAMLADQQSAIEAFSVDGPWHWTRFEGDKQLLYRELAKREQLWKAYRQDPRARAATLEAFRSYAMQWY